MMIHLPRRRAPTIVRPTIPSFQDLYQCWRSLFGPTRTSAMRLPHSSGRKSRTTVSTSGNSGMVLLGLIGGDYIALAPRYYADSQRLTPATISPQQTKKLRPPLEIVPM